MTQEHTSLKLFNKILEVFSGLVFINLLFGPLVRATNSGLACPDWPLCFGKFIPHYHFQVWMEFGHRVVSGTIGLILLYILFLVFKNRYLRERFAKLGIWSIILISTQIFLGGLTIWKYLDPTVVNSHLLNAILFFTVIITMKIKAGYFLQFPEKSRMIVKGHLFSSANLFFIMALAAIFIQIFAGGRVSSNYAGLACPDFPTCNGEWFPALTEKLVRIQMEHRFGAYIAFAFISLAAIFATARVKVKKITIFTHTSLLLILLQILIGYLNIQFGLPNLVTALHTGVAIGIFITMYTAMIHNLIRLSGDK